jgi:ADP-ribosyl-[dinitrogen reductase] hydrolase
LTDTEDRHIGCLIGLACGDAVGTTVEFRERGSFEPLTDMIGGGPFRLRPGDWTDDTSMALCLGESLIESKGFDLRDQAQRYCRWWREGHWSSNGRCFDIGNTVTDALTRFEQHGEPASGSTRPDSAGNGSIMRLAPVVLYYAPDREAAMYHAAESSKVTHGAVEAVDACRLLAAVLIAALEGRPKDEVIRAAEDLHAAVPLAPRLAEIARGAWIAKEEEAIRGSGYVVHSLEAALWCFERTDTFRDAILRAANLGEDADTTAAVCGQIAGAHYGTSGIPSAWKAKLTRRNEIEDMARALHAARPA